MTFKLFKLCPMKTHRAVASESYNEANILASWQAISMSKIKMTYYNNF